MIPMLQKQASSNKSSFMVTFSRGNLLFFVTVDHFLTLLWLSNELGRKVSAGDFYWVIILDECVLLNIGNCAHMGYQEINSTSRPHSSYPADLSQHSSQVAFGRIQNYQPLGSSSSKYLATRRLIRISRDGGKDRTKRKTSYTGQNEGLHGE